VRQGGDINPIRVEIQWRSQNARNGNRRNGRCTPALRMVALNAKFSAALSSDLGLFFKLVWSGIFGENEE
jgi:hypothetical protein